MALTWMDRAHAVLIARHAVLIARHAFLTAPSVTSVVAVDAAQVIGFAYF